MNTRIDFQAQQVAELDPHLLVAALQAFQELTWAADGDIYTDAPECRVSVNRARDAIQSAYRALIQLREALEPELDGDSPQLRALRILDDAEEAFAVKSMAEERALCCGWRKPDTVQDYLFWIEDEALYQLDHRLSAWQDEQRIYIQGLRDLARELRGLGFTPAPAPWMEEIKAGGVER